MKAIERCVMTMIVRQIFLFVVLAGAVILTAGCASDASAHDAQAPRTNEHDFHSNQEHYDRGGAVAPKP
jgi:hypothetical protein